jgi:hypothetical protein
MILRRPWRLQGIMEGREVIREKEGEMGLFILFVVG